MKHVKLFEQFVNEESVNEKKYSSSDDKKLKEFAIEVADEIWYDYEDEFSKGDLDEADFNEEEMFDYIQDWGLTNNLSVKEVIAEFDWKTLRFELGLA